MKRSSSSCYIFHIYLRVDTYQEIIKCQNAHKITVLYSQILIIATYIVKIVHVLLRIFNIAYDTTAKQNRKIPK